jgi:F0F1-type ATP synthase delta subunit
LPLQFGRGRVLPPTDQTAQATAGVEDFVNAASSLAEVVDVSIEVKDGITDVDVVVASPTSGPPVIPLARFLAERLNTPVNVKLQVVEATTSGAIVVDP